MKRNILAVGVDKAISSGIKTRLGEDKFDFICVTGLKEGFDFLQKKKVCVLILNNNLLDGGDYREFCLSIKSDSKLSDIPIILLAEKEEREITRIEVLRSGLINDYIILPAPIEEVFAKLNIFIEVKLLQEELEVKNVLLRKIAITDELTRLYNRRYLLDRLDEEIRRIRRYNYPAACMLMDLDHFKKINDNFGHQTGDGVLQELAQLLKNNLRSVDIVGRYGGEEFLVILPHTDLEKSLIVAERIRNAVMSHRFLAIKEHYRLTLSIGVTACCSGNEISIDNIIKIADEQLYLAKKNGRNRIEAKAYN